VKNERGRNRTALRLNQDGNAEIDIKGKVAGSDERLRTSARWQVLDDRSLHLLGNQSLTFFFERDDVHSSPLLKHENVFYRVKKGDLFGDLASTGLSNYE
jgi:hypothetical protein